jgi:cytoskeleton-associated protein 5
MRLERMVWSRHFRRSSISSILSCLAVYAYQYFGRQFGTQVTQTVPVLKALPKIFGHSDKTVRSEGTNLSHVLYQYLGAGLEPWLADLKPVQVKELKEAWETMEKEGKGKGSLKPERLTRQQAREAEDNAVAADDSSKEVAEEGSYLIL